MLSKGIIRTHEQRRTDEGQAFFTTTNIIAIIGTGENDFFLLKNPVGSGKTLRVYTIVGNIEGGGVGQVSTFRIYKNPTVTANGTAVTLTNKKFTGGNATVMQAFSAPTISARGTLIRAQTAASPTDFKFDMLLSEGDAVLVTVDPTLNNTLHSVMVDWAEE